MTTLYHINTASVLATAGPGVHSLQSTEFLLVTANYIFFRTQRPHANCPFIRTNKGGIQTGHCRDLHVTPHAELWTLNYIRISEADPGFLGVHYPLWRQNYMTRHESDVWCLTCDNDQNGEEVLKIRIKCLHLGGDNFFKHPYLVVSQGALSKKANLLSSWHRPTWLTCLDMTPGSGAKWGHSTMGWHLTSGTAVDTGPWPSVGLRLVTVFTRAANK